MEISVQRDTYLLYFCQLVSPRELAPMELVPTGELHNQVVARCTTGENPTRTLPKLQISGTPLGSDPYHLGSFQQPKLTPLPESISGSGPGSACEPL